MKILTDSVSDVSQQDADKYNIHLFGFTIAVDGKVYQHKEVPNEEFYDIMDNAKSLPTTSQIPEQEIYNAFEQYFNEGYLDLIYVTISSTGSNTLNNAAAAKQKFYAAYPDSELNIHIVDSLNYTVFYGYPVIEAAVKVQKGADSEEVLSYLNDWFEKSVLVGVPYTLEYAKRSGRLSGAAAFAGELLGLKPILRIVNGVCFASGKIRGEKNIIPKLADFIVEHMIPQTPYALLCGSLRSENEDFKKELVKRIGYPPETAVYAGPTVATHIGHKIIGIAFKEKSSYLRDKA
ncbi:MAG: DegV family protein [Oscillospiraceae bacterium]|nr:DegV family protein [Oscillospiraceae bacterium]